MFNHISSIVLGAPGDMRAIAECQIVPFPTVFTLWNTQVYISTVNSSDISANIESLIDDVLSLRTTLGIPDIYPNHYHVQFGRHLDNTWLQCQYNIFEQMYIIKHIFNDI